MDYYDYNIGNIVTDEDFNKLHKEVERDFPAPLGFIPPRLLACILQKAYDLNLIVLRYEYDNQVIFNKQLKAKLKNIDK